MENKISYIHVVNVNFPVWFCYVRCAVKNRKNTSLIKTFPLVLQPKPSRNTHHFLVLTIFNEEGGLFDI